MSKNKQFDEALERKIEHQRRIKQEKKNQESSEFEESYSSFSSAKNNLKEWMKGLELEMEDEVPYVAENNGLSDLEVLGKEDEKELEEVQKKILEKQKLMDKFRYRMLEITREIQSLNKEKIDKTANRQNEIDEQSKIHRKEMETIKNKYEDKINEHLLKIEELLTEKAEFHQQLQIFQTEDNKMARAIKDLEERYTKDIKNAREAFMVLEKEKRDKWEKERINHIKEQSTLKLEPKLQAIIKEGNDDIKKANLEWQQKHVEFTREYTSEVNKKLECIRQNAFMESEKEKENLRTEERNKLKENYEKLQLEFEEDRSKIRRMYKEQILELEKKRREQVDEFLNYNKVSQEEHLTTIKKVREDYEHKIKFMKENVRERVTEELDKIEKQYKRKLEEAEKQIEEENEEKFQKAVKKIDESISIREKESKEKIKEEGSCLERDIDAKYDKKVAKIKKEIEDEKEKLRSKLREVEERLIVEERARTNENSKNTMFHKESLKFESKNADLLLKIKDKENEIARIRQSIADTNSKYEDEIKAFEQEKREEYEKIDRLIGRLRKEEKQIEEEWLEKYSEIDDINLQKTEKLKKEKTSLIEEETKVYKKLQQELAHLKQENKNLTEDIENMRRKLKTIN